MTSDQLRDEWRRIATEAGLTNAQLRERAQARLTGTGRESAPEAWIEAAREVAQEIADAKEEAAAAKLRQSQYVALPLTPAEVARAQLGALVSWKLARETPVVALRDAVAAADLPDALAPALPSPEQRLARAMGPLSERRALVRPLAAEQGLGPQLAGAPIRRRRGGKALVREHVVANGTNLEHEVTVRAVVKRAGGVAQVQVSPPDDSRAPGIAQRFADAARTYDSNQISDWLVECVDHLLGVRVRSRGGMYWVPPKSYETWCRLAAVVEQHGHVVDEIPCLRADRAVATLSRAIEREARGLVEQIAAKVSETVELVEAARAAGKDQDKGMGLRALASKEEEVRKLRDRLAEYEKQLGVSLDKVRTVLDQAQVAVGEAVAARGAAEQVAAGKWAKTAQAAEAAVAAAASLAS